jgi:hypothetical protein
MTRQYSSTSNATTIAATINSTVTTLTVATGTGAALLGGVTLAAGNVDIFTVAIDPDTVNEEIVYVTQRSGDTLTISRGQAGTGTPGVSGISHTSGAAIKHVLTSDDLIFFRNNASPVASFAFSGSTSGTTTVQATAVAGTNTLTLPATSNDTLVGKATTDTLTNKTLSSATLTGTLTAGGGAGTNGQVLASTGTGVQWSTTAAGYSAPTLGSTVIPSATTVTTVAGLTLTSPVLNNPIQKSPEERCTVSATAATGTVAFDTQTQGVLYYTTNASANFTLNFTNVNANLAVGDSISCVFLNTNGATAYYPNAFQIDSSTVTPKWSGGTAPSAGNASSIDAYSFTIIKTAATPTYTVLAGGAVKFA